MKLTFAQIQPLLNNPPEKLRVFLFFGPDSGLAHERAETLVSKLIPDKNDPFAVVSLSGSALGGDEARLYDEAASLVFGGGRRLVRIHQAIETNAKPLASFLENPPPGNSVIVIEAGDLDKKSKLRSLCEGKADNAAGFPCYVEDAAARQRNISAFLEKHKRRAAQDVIRFLESVLPPDRMAMTSELEKLSLYAQDKNEILLEDVQKIISDAGGAEIDDLVQAAASGNLPQTTHLLDYLFAEQTSPVALLRAMQRHLLRLQLASAAMEAGASPTEAIKGLRPPVFWKAVDPMARQLRRWNSTRIAMRLEQLYETEAAVKRTGTPDSSLCAQLFLSIAARP